MATGKFKSALLAASVLAAAGAGAAHAADHEAYAPPASHVMVVDTIHESEAAAVPAIAKKVGLAAMATAALAAFYRLIGGERLKRWMGPAGPVVAGAARTVAAGAAKAAQAVGDTVKKPVRSLLLFAGLGIFALTGVNFLDIEWTAGLILGAATVAIAWAGERRMRARAAKARARTGGSGSAEQRQLSEDL